MTTQQVAREAALNALTREVTAFANWWQFKAAMVGGYCPTLRIEPVTKRMSQKQRFFNECVNKLREMVRAEGFRVFDGVKVA